jgi:NAD+ synthase (glutamine-hydrolysing)
MSSGQYVTVATCNLNQWAMDFDGNMDRILDSCRRAKEAGATYRLGPELEIPGYGCEDHFLEMDTVHHSWESLVKLLQQGATDELLCDFGMPVLHRGVRYNCRVLALNKKVLLIRPKLALADDGNYRESRWFTAFRASRKSALNEEFVFPPIFQQNFGQHSAPFGIHSIQFPQDGGLTIGCESCEELWTANATHIELGLLGVDIIGNGSGSHHELRKLDVRLDLAFAATRTCGGIYCYANQRGCDGGRLYYDGGAFIAVNGKLLAQARQFSLTDVEVVTATIDLDEIRSFRASIASRGVQSSVLHERLDTEQHFVKISGQSIVWMKAQNSPTSYLARSQSHCPEEECCIGPACWLWDYLRRSGASGYFLPLSGGADSSATATIVGAMCAMVSEAAKTDSVVARDCRRICMVDDDTWRPTSPQELARLIFHTSFMSTENSSEVTKSRAQALADVLGSYHVPVEIDSIVSAILDVFNLVFGQKPKFVANGGSYTEDLALQNIQARIRMVIAYLLAQLLPWVRGKSGFLLVLGSANVDEGLRGYMTKYDCSSADLNPIGAISKGDLKRMLIWASNKYDYKILADIAGAPPTAELRPRELSTEEHSQLDEEEMGMTYEELGYFGRLRKIDRCGPVSM